jgi:heme-degrading monooxygenase HmoA
MSPLAREDSVRPRLQLAASVRPLNFTIRRSRRMPTTPILEVAVLNVRAGESARFEAAFRIAEPIICASPGYLSHQLRRCVEVEGRYLLLVRWRTLEDHTIGFRGSPRYQDWKRLLHHFYDPFPTVEHFEQLRRDGV